MMQTNYLMPIRQAVETEYAMVKGSEEIQMVEVNFRIGVL